jgi:hypothetical protein
LYLLLRICSCTSTKDIRYLIKLSFNTPKPTRGLDALSISFWRKLSSFVFVMNSPWWMAGHSQPYAFLSFYGILALSLKLEVLLIYARLM